MPLFFDEGLDLYINIVDVSAADERTNTASLNLQIENGELSLRVRNENETP